MRGRDAIAVALRHPDGHIVYATERLDSGFHGTRWSKWPLIRGLVVGFPTALPTGMAKGVGAGVTFGACPLRWGARAAWVTAQESSTAWTVRQSDLRLRLTGSAHYDAGRGSLAVRLGVGGTLVHETRDRNQGMRAGLSGDELQTTAFRMMPAADLEAVVALHVLGPWLMTVSGGPTAAIHDGGLHGGWIAALGVAWAP